jgi:hypothetical protein
VTGDLATRREALQEEFDAAMKVLDWNNREEFLRIRTIADKITWIDRQLNNSILKNVPPWW